MCQILLIFHLNSLWSYFKHFTDFMFYRILLYILSSDHKIGCHIILCILKGQFFRISSNRPSDTPQYFMHISDWYTQITVTSTSSVFWKPVFKMWSSVLHITSVTFVHKKRLLEYIIYWSSSSLFIRYHNCHLGKRL